MTNTGHELSDIGRTLSWSALHSFITQIGPDSALAKSMDRELADWSGRVKTNAILADIFDLLAAINANLVGLMTRKRPKQPKPYPRPGREDAGRDEKKFGRGALPVDELRKWIAEKQRVRND